MGIIEIIKIPPGEAPESVRKEWVGLKLPLVDELPTTIGHFGVVGVKSKRPVSSGGYPVDTKTAVEILEKKSPEAAAWWKENLDFRFYPILVFAEGCAKLL
jgi:hypothetical protein